MLAVTFDFLSEPGVLVIKRHTNDASLTWSLCTFSVSCSRQRLTLPAAKSDLTRDAVSPRLASVALKSFSYVLQETVDRLVGRASCRKDAAHLQQQPPSESSG